MISPFSRQSGQPDNALALSSPNDSISAPGHYSRDLTPYMEFYTFQAGAAILLQDFMLDVDEGSNDSEDDT